MKCLSVLMFALMSLSIFGAGFTMPKGQIYFKIGLDDRSIDEAYNAAGDRFSNPEQSGLENGLEATALNSYLAYGVTDRFTLAANVQWLDMQINERFTEASTNDGLSDVWLTGLYRLYQGKFSVVANGVAKLPLQDNEARTPQLTNGEAEYMLGVGVGYGAARFYVEGDLGYNMRTGTVNDVQTNGLDYEDEWRASIKVGVSATQRLRFEGLLKTIQTEADMESADFIAGTYTNFDETVLSVNGSYAITKALALGVQAERTVSGKNVLLTESVGVFGAYSFNLFR